VNGLVLDTSALLAYASGASVEPGAIVALAEEDPDQQVWIPTLCLGQARLEVAGSPAEVMLDVLLTADRDIQVAAFDVAVSRPAGRIAARFGVPLDAAHAVITAVLYRCYLVTCVPRTVSAATPPDLDLLSISRTWD
jgi:hypothetical protein